MSTDEDARPRFAGQRTASAESVSWPDTPAPAPAAEGADLSPGDRVRHRLFGEGTVLKVSAEAGSTTVDVLFKTAGKKTLDLSFARLEKM